MFASVIRSLFHLRLQLSLQDQVDAEVKVLLALKADYKVATGKDWKPGAHKPAAPVPTPAPAPPAGLASADDINENIVQQGNKVRQLKADKAAKVKFNFFVRRAERTWFAHETQTHGIQVIPNKHDVGLHWAAERLRWESTRVVIVTWLTQIPCCVSYK